jgi:hypothetical protein
MAMKKRFYSVNGQMMGYEEGGVKKDFLTDHLGSITAEIDQTQTRTYDTRYSAYGRNNWSTGTGCGFGWVGSYGYRETGLLKMSHYVRARHYSYVTGGWSTVDPLWPDESAYGQKQSCYRPVRYEGLLGGHERSEGNCLPSIWFEEWIRLCYEMHRKMLEGKTPRCATSHLRGRGKQKGMGWHV